jgi:O-antigen/teichoic acid export membrane protein
MGVYMRSDSIMLERMEGPVQNSLYAATYRILDIANMSGFLFAGILLPMFSRLLSRNHDVRELVVSSTNILVSISLALVAFSLMYSQEIMQMLYTKDANQLALLYKFTIGSFPAFCLMYVFSTLLTANGNISLLVKIAGLGGLLSLILNYILISKFQAIGAAAASLIVEWILAFIYIFYCKQQIQLTFTWKWVIKFPTIFISILAFNAVLHPIVSSTILASVLNIIFFLVLVYTIKLWDRESILNYMNQFKSNG